MATDTAKVKWVSDSQQMQADYDKMYAKTGKVELANQRLKKEINEVAKAGSQMSAGTKKALDDSVTAAEKYRTTMAGLRKELDSGRITEERYNAARKAAQATFKATDPASRAAAMKKEGDALKKLAEAEKEEAKQKQIATEITNRNRTAIERHAEGLKIAKKAYENNRISAEAYRREVDRLNSELKESESPGKIAEMVTNFAAGVTVVGLLKTGLQAVNAELDLQLEKQRKIAGIQKSYAEKSREMRDNFKEDATIGSVADLDKTVLGISERTGIDPEIVVDAMTAGLGQKGDKTNKQVADTVEHAVRYSRTDAGKAVELTQRALLLSNVSGVSDMKATMGFIAEAANASAIPSIEKFGATGARAINDTVRRGATPEQAAELFATINKSMGDVEGNRSATATTQLVEQMATFVPQAKHEDNNGEFSVPQAQRDAWAKAKTPNQKLAVMQRSPELRRAFLGKGGASFETAAQASIEGLLSASPEAMRLMREAEGKVPTLNAANAGALGQAFDDEIQRLDSGQVQANARGQQGQAADQKRRSIEAEEKGKGGTVDSILFDEQSGIFHDPKVNLPGIDSFTRSQFRTVYKGRLAMGQAPTEAARAELETLKQSAKDVWGSDSADTKTLINAVNETLKRIEALNRGQLDEQKQEKADRKVSMAPSAPGQPLLQGGNAVMTGDGRGLYA